jgi:hypothetical protein
MQNFITVLSVRFRLFIFREMAFSPSLPIWPGLGLLVFMLNFSSKFETIRIHISGIASQVSVLDIGDLNARNTRAHGRI